MEKNTYNIVILLFLSGLILFTGCDELNPPEEYSSILLIATTPCQGITSISYSGQTYNTVETAYQCWLKENLNVGTRINGSVNPSNNGTIEKYCYNNNEANCATYGGLYDWNEAMAYSTTPRAQGICPVGWHIPTYDEFIILLDAVGHDGNKLKREDQGTGNGVGTNTSGFSALLAGSRNYNGIFDHLGYYTFFWSSTEGYATNVYNLYLWFNDSDVYMANYSKDHGYSIRCLKD